MNVRWLRAPLLGAMVFAGTLMGTSTAQAQPRIETRVVWRHGHPVYVRVVREVPRRRYYRYQRHFWYDRHHHRHYYYSRDYYR